jgi:hypothetical protein
MKKLIYLSVLAVMTMMTMCVFTACGGDDNDEDLPVGYVKTTEGVHRIEVTFEGDLTGWQVDMLFIAVHGDGGPAKFYENGQLVADEGGYEIETLRNCAVETDAKCDQMDVTMTMKHGSFSSVSPVTVTLRSFINGQPKKVKTVKFTESYKTIVFDSELDADKY